MAEETWKDIEGYKGYYQVSDAGNVRSIDRYVNHLGTDTSNFMHFKGKRIKLRLHPKGRVTVHLCKEGKVRNLSVARLVAKAFIPNPHNLPFLRHIDENRTNNCADNLEWSGKLILTDAQRAKMVTRTQPERLTEQATETWVDIQGYEGYYQVSDAGNVRSIDRYVNHWGSNTLGPIYLKSRSISACPSATDGQLRVRLFRDGKHRTFCVARLVAKTFIPNPHNFRFVHHIDGNKTNNHSWNLEWFPRACKVCMTDAKRAEILALYEQGIREEDIAEIYHISVKTIESAIERATQIMRDAACREAIRESGYRIDLNTTTVNELVTVGNISEAIAERIINGRPYTTVEDLLSVKGIGKKRLEDLKTIITCSRNREENLELILHR